MLRRVQSESATGASERVRMMLTLSVESVDFDTAAGVLRVHGRNVEENEHVKARMHVCKLSHHAHLNDGR